MQKPQAELVEEDAALRDRIATPEAAPTDAREPGGSPADRSQDGAFLQTLVDGFLLVDAHGRFCDANAAYCRMVGYTRQELLTMAVPDVEANLTRAEIARHIQEIVRTGSAQFETRHRRKDGGIIDLEVSVNSLPNEEVRLVAFLRDVTLRKRADRALAERTQQLEAARAVSEEITRELDLTSLLALIHRRAAELVGAVSGTVYLWDESDGALIPAAHHGLADWVGGVRIRAGEGIAGAVAEHRRGILCNDYRASQDTHPLFRQQTRITAALVEPLLFRDRLLGVIAVNHEAVGQQFGQEDQGILRLFASQAAIAIENARLYEAAQRELAERQQAEAALRSRTSQLDALRTVSEEITREMRLPALLELLLEHAMRLAGAEGGSVLLWDEAASALVPEVWVGREPSTRASRIALGEGVSGTAAAQRRGLIVNDYRRCPFARPEILERTKITAALAEPLLYQERLVGVINLDNGDTGRTFSEEHGEFLRLLASQAAIAIENARLYEATKRRAEHFATLNDIARALTTTLEPLQVAEQTLKAVRVLLPDAAARFWKHGPEVGVFRNIAAVGMRDRFGSDTVRFPPGEGLLGLALSTRQPVISRDVHHDPRFRERAKAAIEDVVSCVMLPLLAPDHVCGVLAIFTRTAHDFSQEELALLSAFAAHAAIAMENARLFAELKKAYEDLRRAQEELIRSEKLHALGQMAAGMAHDLNNVLAAILGQAELLRLRAPDPAVLEALNTLVVASTDGAHIVRRLQDFARQQPGRPLAPVDLAPLVREALEITRPQWRDEPQHRGAVIHVDAELGDLPAVLGNAAEIREALTNLILNAVDAMPQGGALTLTGRMASDDGDGTGFVELKVADTGVGIPDEVRRRIFDPFFTTKGVRGTGLGLSVVYGIMQRHGGRIDVASALGMGTTFALRFKVASDAGAAPSQPSAGGAVRPRRLLLIDDDVSVRSTMTDLLREVGHSVTVAEGGAEGLAHLSQGGVDVVITDLGMPGMTGWEVARSVKTIMPHVPIVLLTGWGESPANHSEHSGLVDRILGKPVRLSEILSAIRDLTEPVGNEPATTSAGQTSP